MVLKKMLISINSFNFEDIIEKLTMFFSLEVTKIFKFKMSNSTVCYFIKVRHFEEKKTCLAIFVKL